MKNRLIIGISGTILLLVVLIFLPAIALRLVVYTAMIIAIHEIHKALKFNKALILYAYTIAIAYALVDILQQYTQLKLNSSTVLLVLAPMLYLILYLHPKIKLKSISTAFFILTYICYFLSFIIQVRDMPNGLYLVIFLLLGAWITDACAYFSGMLFGRGGKHKLYEEVSPKKTIEGSIGGAVGTVIILVLYGMLLQNKFGLNVNYISVVVLAILCTTMAQLGDLCASKIKRESQIKDFGTLLPGHGGILDRVDSVLFVAPIVYMFASYFPIIW
ncbi:MAG: phosphatidate cytidylyltransferase [Clostridiales bacterium]|nr:phosphatidate cytidylyltransferase [Clostridiales bacterium]